MENGNGIDSCNKAEVNSEKKAETIVIMALEEGKPASDYGVADDKLKMCTVDNDNDSLPNQNAELLEAVTAEENVELKDSPIEKTTNEEVKQNGDVAESANNVLTIKVEPKPIETVEEKPLSPPPEKMSVEASEEKAKEAPVEEAKQEMIEEEMQDENDKKNLGDLEMEDQQSSTSSSPSALHIHLDEEDKDESLNDKDKETVDPSLPLISNVVSLSSIASSSSSLTPPPPTHFHHSPSTQPPSPTPSAESGNSSVRRTTLRFKRGIEISFDVDQNGQPVTVNNHETAAMPSASSEEPRQKRGRIEDEDEEDTNQPDVSELDAEGTNNVLSSVQKDIRTLRFMAKQKEKEWNYILKLMKVKEELQAKLMRRREVLKITSSSSRKIQPNSSQIHTVAQTHIQPQQQSGAANLQTLINHSLNAMMGKSSGSSKSIMSNSPAMNHQQSQQLIQQQQLHHQQIQQQQLHQHQLQQQAKMNRQRPILPKPSMQIHPEVQIWSQQQNQQQSQHHHHHHNNHNSSNQQHHHHHHHNTVVDSVVGACADSQADARNRQGTISVQSLIADYRAKHPEEIPTRGRRIRQPSRICNDPNSSSSPPPNSQPGGQEGANMSFKDVLLQFAKMSSRQGHANPVDMIQVGKESPGTSGNSAMAGSSGSSSAAALQSLAAARNARSSPHTAGLSAGSILQSALSGSRTNPNFAPTLAQLLTNPANEQQQQHPQQLPLGGNQPTVSIPTATASSSASSAAVAAAAAAASVASSAEVLTLSNLLATARGHVTITSERSDLANDDVTVVGGSTSGGRNVSSNNGNYLRTSGGGEVPKCQGCNERVAQFVCAGCSSQWYCSRECQVAAWEEHSEHCVG